MTKLAPPQDPPIPSDVDTEKALLGSCFINPDAILQAATLVKPEDFYIAAHAAIFEAMLVLTKENVPIDQLTVRDQVRKAGKDEMVPNHHLYDLLSAVPSAVHVASYCEIVAAMAERRRLINDGAQIVRLAYDMREGNPRQKAMSIIERQKGLTPNARSLGQMMPAYLSEIEEAMQQETPPGLSTGFPALDHYSRLVPGDLTIIAGRPSMGKTSLALNVALNTARWQGAAVLICSLEMTGEQLMHRLISQVAKVDSKKIAEGRLTDEEYGQVVTQSGLLAGLDIVIEHTPSPSVSNVRFTARGMMEQGLDLIVIDYLQLMATERDFRNRQLEISTISRGLKMLARELHVPIVVVSQLSRGTESRNDKRPMLSDLRDSGAIEQDADVVAFVYRESVYNTNAATPNLAEIIIAKNRNGGTGTIQLHYSPELTLFSTPKIIKEKLQ